MKKVWSQFYPLFTEAYKKRERLYQDEFAVLEKMRTSFDRFYPYAAHLNSLIQNKVFLSAKFEELFNSIKAYYEKANDNIQEVRIVIKDYSNVLNKRKKHHVKSSVKPSLNFKISDKKNKKSKINKIVLNTESDSKLMISQRILLSIKIGLKKDEVYSFQNQYVSIQIYIKSFLNYVMKKIQETTQNNEKLKFKYSNRINRIKQRISFLNTQKQKLFEQMLQ